MNEWTSKQINRLKSEYPAYPNTRELAKKMGITYSALRSKAKVMKLKRTYRYWTEEMEQFLKMEYPNKRISEILPLLKAMNPKINSNSIEAKAFKLRLKKTEQFKKEMGVYGKSLQGPAWNKGMKGWSAPGSEKTRFKKGSKPHNTLSDGAITKRKDTKTGRVYYWIRIQEGVWEMLHVNVYKKVYGNIPEGNIVIFKDGNSMNCEIENLQMISIGDNMNRNTIHNLPAEIVEIIRIQMRINKKIQKLTQNGSKQNY